MVPAWPLNSRDASILRRIDPGWRRHRTVLRAGPGARGRIGARAGTDFARCGCIARQLRHADAKPRDSTLGARRAVEGVALDEPARCAAVRQSASRPATLALAARVCNSLQCAGCAT